MPYDRIRPIIFAVVILGNSSYTYAEEDDDALHESDSSVSSIFSSAYFSDVRFDTWYYIPVQNLYARKVVNGYENGKFLPNNSITRAEAIKIMANSYAGSLGNTSSMPFNDIGSHWAQKEIVWAYNMGIVNGTGNGMFSPDDNVTRQDFAVMAFRYCDNAEKFWLPTNINQSNFKDHSSIASYATTSVYRLQRANIISGDQNKYFHPKANITRAEAAKIIHGIIYKLNHSVLDDTQEGLIRCGTDPVWFAHCESSLRQYYRKSSDRITFYEVDNLLSIDYFTAEHDGTHTFYPGGKGVTRSVPIKRNGTVVKNRSLPNDTRKWWIADSDFYNLTYYPAHKFSTTGTYSITCTGSIEIADYINIVGFKSFSHSVSVSF